MARPLERRAPRAQFGFSWGRVIHNLDGKAQVEYRLFIRERDSGKLYAEFLKVPGDTFDRAGVARLIRARRAQLKWVRDRLELERLGLQDMTPRPVVQ